MTGAVDVALREDGELVLPPRWISGRELVAQRMRIRLRTFAGDYILDRSQGLAYIEWRGAKITSLDTIRAAVGAELLGTPGVERLAGITAELDGRTVRLRASVVLTEDTDDSTEEQVAIVFGAGDCVPSPLSLLQLIWSP